MGMIFIMVGKIFSKGKAHFSQSSQRTEQEFCLHLWSVSNAEGKGLW
jgi:hypothetical protein